MRGARAPRLLTLNFTGTLVDIGNTAAAADLFNPTGVALAPDGSTVVTGFFHGTATFSPTTSIVSTGVQDIFVAKYATNGSL